MILGIETSCDETGLALVEAQSTGWRVVSEVLASQHTTHQPYGGVVPELAAREHLRALPLLLEELFRRSSRDADAIEGIAVTRGPGLVGCLLMGLSFAAGLAQRWRVPCVGVNHIEGHLLAPMLDNPELEFPYLALVVSGGHTELHIVRGVGQYELLERTLDDAAGEAFDKAAHLLGFSYPGGPQLARLADSYSGRLRYSLPKVMRSRPGFSFSGLKTAIALLVERESLQGVLHDEQRAALAAAVQESIVEALLYKVQQALKKTRLRQIVVTGGVSANLQLRRRILELGPGVRGYFPKPEHSVDNAAMIAFVGALRGSDPAGGIECATPLSRWPVETLGACT